MTVYVQKRDGTELFSYYAASAPHVGDLLALDQEPIVFYPVLRVVHPMRPTGLLPPSPEWNQWYLVAIVGPPLPLPDIPLPTPP